MPPNSGRANAFPNDDFPQRFEVRADAKRNEEARDATRERPDRLHVEMAVVVARDRSEGGECHRQSEPSPGQTRLRATSRYRR
jgi:hypothetical protein